MRGEDKSSLTAKRSTFKTENSHTLQPEASQCAHSDDLFLSFSQAGNLQVLPVMATRRGAARLTSLGFI